MGEKSLNCSGIDGMGRRGNEFDRYRGGEKENNKNVNIKWLEVGE